MQKCVGFFAFFALMSSPVSAQTVSPEVFEGPEVTDSLPAGETPSELTDVVNTQPDYSHLTPEAERAARLDVLFERLKAEKNAEDAELIAEEIWAIWLDSGSASVNMVLLRGTAFEKVKNYASARRMYDHVTTLLPEYAEGWARSARLAYLEEDYDRALADSAQALIYEPREFYALWTMGNVLEKLNRSEQAFEVYKEALKLYPEHPSIKARVTSMEAEFEGTVL